MALLSFGNPTTGAPFRSNRVPFQILRPTVTPSDAMTQSIAELDDWCVATISANPSILGIALTPDQVKERYASSIKVSDKGYQTLRAKMNKPGRYSLRCYDAEKEPIAHPSAWRGISIRLRFVFKGLWVMGKAFWTILECTHAIVQSSEGCEECPF